MNRFQEVFNLAFNEKVRGWRFVDTSLSCLPPGTYFYRSFFDEGDDYGWNYDDKPFYSLLTDKALAMSMEELLSAEIEIIT